MVLSILPALLWAQQARERFTPSEKVYIARSDSFLIKNWSKQSASYFKPDGIYYYTQTGDILTFPNDVTNPKVTHIITSYELTIPELNLKTSTDLVFNRQTNSYYFKDSASIPHYILRNTNRDILDTGEIRNILLHQYGLSHETIRSLGCYYHDSLDMLVYVVHEIVIPSNKETDQGETINEYLLNAYTGELISLDKNILINRTPHVR